MKLTTSIIRHFIYLLVLSFISPNIYCRGFVIRGNEVFIVSQNPHTNPGKDISSLTVDSFIGACNDKQIILKWVTLTRVMSTYFVVEKSYDAINWIEIGTINGSTSYSERSSYSFTDSEGADNISYYRLKHIDYSGSFFQSKIIEVSTCYGGSTQDMFMLYPNPSIGIYNLLVSEDNNTPKTIEIFNHLGEQMYQSDNFQGTIDLSANPIGLYFVHFNFNGKIVIRKVILSKD